MKKRIIIILIIIISIVVICFIFGNKKEGFKEYVYIPEHNEIISKNISMKESYKQQIIDNSLEYLDTNKIVLRDNFTIDTDSIIESDECDGTISFKAINDTYQQIVDLECPNDGKSSSEFSSYLFDAKEKSPIDLKKINDGYLMFSFINIITSEDENGYVGYKNNDINITKVDKDFNLIWSYDYLVPKEKRIDSIDDEGDNEEESEDTEDEESEEIEEDDYDDDYEGDEKETSEENEEEYYTSYIDYVIEKNEKLFFIITVVDDSEDSWTSRLLILNKDGSLYKVHMFEYDESIEDTVATNDKIVMFSNDKEIYTYSFKKDELSGPSKELNKDGSVELLDIIDNGYLMASYVDNYYDYDDKYIEEGNNSLFILDNKMKVKESLDLDKTIGLTKDESGIDYEEIKVIDNKIYISYQVMKEDDDSNPLSYPGILIVDNELNIISDIKYIGEAIKLKDGELEISEIFNYYVYNNELYVLLELEDETTILIDKYDINGKKLLVSFERETNSVDEFEEYYSSFPTILDYNKNEIIYYSIISAELEVGDGKDNRVIIKLTKVNI